MKLQIYVLVFEMFWIAQLYSLAAVVRERYYQMHPKAVTA